MTSEAAALTEQIAELLAEHAEVSRLARGVESCTCGEAVMGRPGWFREHLAEVLAARLADSRPAVTEGAIEAAAEALWDWEGYDNEPETEAANWFRTIARAALSAALPHMGDGKADAWDEGHDCCINEFPGDCPGGLNHTNPYRLSPTGDDSE